MKKIEPLWQQLVESRTVTEENRALGDLKSYLASGKISFRATVLDAQGKEIAYNDISADFQIEAVRIQFFVDGATFEGKLWKPKDLDNLYVLFRE